MLNFKKSKKSDYLPMNKQGGTLKDRLLQYSSKIKKAGGIL